MISLRVESRLSVDAATLWQHATSMHGVNYELMPWVRMTHPAEFSALPDGVDLPKGVIFQSWLLALGCVPFDRHGLRLEAVGPGMRFDENSASWMQRVWRHHRCVEAVGHGCVVIDELQVEPRLQIAAPIVRGVVTQLFEHRHRRLRQRFGVMNG